MITEIGSGLNGHRPKLMKLLADPKCTVIIVGHRDRLMRFGSEYVESALAAQGRKLVVIEPARKQLGKRSTSIHSGRAFTRYGWFAGFQGKPFWRKSATLFGWRM